MKRLLIIAVAMLVAMQMQAQKVGYVNTEKILQAIPAYNSAKSELENLSKEYKEKVESEFAVVEKMFNNYQANKANMTQNARYQRENEIIEKEESAKKLQESYFGENGAMQKRSEELLTPIQKRVKAAVDKLAEQGGYMLIIDIASKEGILYTSEKYDISNEVIKLL